MNLIPIGLPGFTAQSGVTLELFAADATYTLELQRAPDSLGPVVGSAVTLNDSIPGTQPTYTDPLPVDGTLFWYRLRATGFGDTASAWTGWVSAKAILLGADGKGYAPNRIGGFRGYTGFDLNARLVDQRHSNLITVATQASQQSAQNVISAVASTNTVTVAAHTLDMGWGSISYNSGSLVGILSGIPAGTVVYVYTDDPTFAGGAVTYSITILAHDLVLNSGRYYVGKFTMPSSGTVTGGGGGGFRSGAL